MDDVSMAASSCSRRAVIWFSVHDLMDIIGERRHIRWPLPDDVRALRVGYDFQRDAVGLLLSSAGFDEVEEGCSAPTLYATWERD